MPTLAELRAQAGPKPLPRKTVTVTLVEGQHLLAEFEALTVEATDLVREKDRIAERVSGQNADGEQTGPPRKSGQGSEDAKRAAEIESRITEIEARVKALPNDLREHQNEITLIGIEGGAWQRFKDENPPREGNDQDKRLTSGHCDASALFAALGRFVREWEGEPIPSGEWDSLLAEKVAYADRRDLIPTIVQMYESKAATLPKSRSASPMTASSATD